LIFSPGFAGAFLTSCLAAAGAVEAGTGLGAEGFLGLAIAGAAGDRFTPLVLAADWFFI
jgi:hypothetical protein